MTDMNDPYFESKDFCIYNGDSLALIDALEDNSIDVVFADPPYFLSSGRKMDIAGRHVHFEKGIWEAESSIKCKFTELVCRTPELVFENLIFPLVWN